MKKILPAFGHEGGMNNLWENLTPQVQAIIRDDKNWSTRYMIESCALCKKPFGEDYVALHLWKNDGHWSISFHMKCAFGDKVVESEEPKDFENQED